MDPDTKHGNIARDIQLYAIYCACLGADIDPDPGETLGATIGPELDSYLGPTSGSISWNKFAPSKI